MRDKKYTFRRARYLQSNRDFSDFLGRQNIDPKAQKMNAGQWDSSKMSSLSSIEEVLVVKIQTSKRSGFSVFACYGLTVLCIFCCWALLPMNVCVRAWGVQLNIIVLVSPTLVNNNNSLTAGGNLQKHNVFVWWLTVLPLLQLCFQWWELEIPKLFWSARCCRIENSDCWDVWILTAKT